MFSAIDIGASGVQVDQTWIDTIGGNVANMNDAVTPGRPVYRAEYVDASPVAVAQAEAPGVGVAAIQLAPAAGVTAYEPGNPAASTQGLVTYPEVSLSEEMVSLVAAQASYQANADVISHADRAYQAIMAMKD